MTNAQLGRTTLWIIGIYSVLYYLGSGGSGLATLLAVGYLGLSIWGAVRLIDSEKKNKSN